MELFNSDSGCGHRRHRVPNEVLVFENTGKPVLGPEFARQPVPGRIDEYELDFVADLRAQTGLGQSGFDTPQRSPGTRGHRVAVLIEKQPRCPGKSVVDPPECGCVDAYPLVTDDADLVGEGDPGAVDRETMPGRTRTKTGIDECGCATGRNNLRQRQPGRIDDGSDDGVVADTTGRAHRSVQARLGSVSEQA